MTHHLNQILCLRVNCLLSEGKNHILHQPLGLLSSDSPINHSYRAWATSGLTWAEVLNSYINQRKQNAQSSKTGFGNPGVTLTKLVRECFLPVSSHGVFTPKQEVKKHSGITADSSRQLLCCLQASVQFVRSIWIDLNSTWVTQWKERAKPWELLT